MPKAADAGEDQTLRRCAAYRFHDGEPLRFVEQGRFTGRAKYEEFRDPVFLQITDKTGEAGSIHLSRHGEGRHHGDDQMRFS